MKKHLSFILLAAMALTLLLPFSKPQTVQAEGWYTVYQGDQFWADDGAVVYYLPFHDTENLYSDASKFQLVSEKPDITEPVNVKISGPYGTGSLKLFTVEYSLNMKAAGEADLDLVYDGKTAKEKFTHIKLQQSADTNTDKPHAFPMYRIYNPNSGEHFYTSAEKEKTYLISLGWKDEGVCWYATDHDNEESGDPVYRLYNANAGEHHYTTSEKEKTGLVAAGWKDEGIGWYSAPEQSSYHLLTVPVYRLYNPNAFANNHNYTTSEKERDVLVALGWKDEGTAWYTYF